MTTNVFNNYESIAKKQLRYWLPTVKYESYKDGLSQKLKNILKEEFNPARPDAVWCSDIPQLLNNVLKDTPIKMGSNSNGLFADYVFNGNTYRAAYGTNGYIVSFYPID